MNRNQLLEHLNELLDIDSFQDYSPNGLQFEGREEVSKIAYGVSFSHELATRAAVSGADTIIVHHGEFFKGGDHRLIGPTKKRFQVLFEHDINLIGYHLPLDAHKTLGNNARILEALGGVQLETPFALFQGNSIGLIGEIDDMTLDEIVIALEMFSKNPILLPYGPERIQKVAISSGGSSDFLPEAIEKGVDLFICGESKEWNDTYAKERGVHVLYLGHRNSEKGGVWSLLEYIREKFQIDGDYIDIPSRI